MANWCKTLLILLPALSWSPSSLADFDLHAGQTKSPYLREAQLEMDRGNYFSAIGLLLAERGRGKLGREADTAELMLAESYFKYGMHEEAGQILNRIKDENLGSRTMGSLWLELANMRYRRGYFQEAEQALTNLDEERVPYNLLAEKLSLLGLIYLQQGRDKDAITALRGVRGDGDWALLSRYNLATTLIRNNQIEQGTKTLQENLRLIPGGPEMSALRDRYLYILGFVALQSQDLELARKNFSGIRLDSPVANRALLGMGLAYASHNRHEEAIRVWDELRRRHASDPSVLESLLAVPLSYMELGGSQQSIDLFQDALDIYEREVKRINDISMAVKDGSLIDLLLQQAMTRGDDFLEAANMPGLPEFRYLQGLYESHPFQVAVNNYRDLRQMELRLRDWATSLRKLPQMSAPFRKVYADKVAAKQSELLTTAEELKQHITHLALDELQQRKSRILMYSRHAMFAVAQNYDNRAFAPDTRRGR